MNSVATLVTKSLRLCTKCKIKKPLTSFGTGKKSSGKLNPRCKECYNAGMTEWRSKNRDHVNACIRASYAKNKDRWVDQILKRKFGISINEYNKMFSDQRGCCATCKRHQSEFNKRLAVDHDHTTGVVRGLLCASCNNALGRVRDDTEVLKSMINYLTNAKQRQTA